MGEGGSKAGCDPERGCEGAREGRCTSCSHKRRGGNWALRVLPLVEVAALLYGTFVATYKCSKRERGGGVSMRNGGEVVSKRWG